MNRVVGRELSFTEDFVVIPTIDLEIQLFVGKLWLFMNRVGKLSTTLFMNRVGKLSTTLSMNRVGKLNTTLSMNRVVRWELVLQRICRNSDRFILRSNTCGLVMTEFPHMIPFALLLNSHYFKILREFLQKSSQITTCISF